MQTWLQENPETRPPAATPAIMSLFVARKCSDIIAVYYRDGIWLTYPLKLVTSLIVVCDFFILLLLDRF